MGFMDYMKRKAAEAKQVFSQAFTQTATRDFSSLKETVKAQAGLSNAAESLGPLALAVVVVAITVGIGAIILSEMSNVTENTEAVNVLDKGLSALTDFADFFTIIVIVSIAAVIFLLLRFVRASGMNATR